MKKYSLLLVLLVLTACQVQTKTDSPPISNAEKQIAKDLIQGSFDDLWAGM